MSSIYSRDYQQFLAKLKMARKQAKMTQVEVARHLSLPQSFVSKCESGERRVDIVELSRFAKLYRKPLSYFLPPELKIFSQHSALGLKLKPRKKSPF